ncbi:MAG: cellulose synthase subunit BcsC-related outer membrane protein [Gallionella sp.]|nr:cellulose synthase subunit BcsC-related outer membrane protein [Gallionella sp.]
MFKLNKIAGSIGMAIMSMQTCYAEAGFKPTLAVNNQNSAMQSLHQNIMLALNDAPIPKQDRISQSAAVDALLVKARYWKAHNRADLAATAWERILHSNHRQEEALAGLALYHAKLKNTVQAEEYLNKLKQVNPKQPVIGDVERILYPNRTPTVAAPVVPENLAREKIKLANQLFEHGNYVEAEAAYREILTIVPKFPEGLFGVAIASLKLRKFDNALSFFDQYESVKKDTTILPQLRSEALTGKGAIAEAAGDIPSAIQYYAQANSLYSKYPWVTLSLARLQRKQGDAATAHKTIETMTASAQDRDTNFMAALFYAEENQWALTLPLLDHIPEKERSGAMRELRSRAIVYVKSDLAKKLYAEEKNQEAIEALSSVEDDAGGKPELIAVVTETWVKIKQNDHAIAFLERNKPLTPGAQLQYGWLLLQANQDVKLNELFAEIDSHPDVFSSEQLSEWDEIRIVLAVRQADALDRQERASEGLSLLAPLLAKYPQNVNLLLAQGRLQATARDLPAALKVIDSVLVIEPGNHEAVRQGTMYAIQMRDYPKADQYLAGSRLDDAQRVDLYVDAGHTAESQQNLTQAEVYFEVARELGAHVKVVDISESPDRQLAGSQIEHDGYFETGYSMRYKSGLNGLSYLYESEVPLTWHVPLEDKQSSFVFKATNVNLNAGDAALWLDLFGTNLPVPAVLPSYPVSANGMAFSAGYQSRTVSADIGVSPQGFAFNHVVGGLRVNQDIDGSNYALEVSRRSLAESVLSYAGAVDNITGVAWGGVTKMGGQASIYSPISGPWAAYASMGLYSYEGANVLNNTSNHFSASLIYELVHTDTFKASISGRLSRTGFDNNQNYFYWGHGGYYSPQRELSFSLPLHLTGKTETLNYEINISPGIAEVVETPSWIYPTDPLRQAAMLPPTGVTLGNIVGAKGTWRTDWTVEYAVAKQLVLGNRFHYDEAPAYKQLGAMLYLRYDFEQGHRTSFPPSPTRPYYLSSQSGAGLN